MFKSIGVPLCDIQAQFRELEPEINDAVQRVLISGQVINGPEVERLEDEVARYCTAGYGVACASGTDALLLALQALGVGAGDEVILPTFTFFATAGSVCRSGARPVFVDSEPRTFNIDPDQVAAKITGRTRAIIAVHLFGQTADMEPVWKIAARHHLIVIEDAAQAIGAAYQGKRTGTLGGLACFSFYPSKNLGGCGDGGMVVTSDPEWAAHMRALRVHGMTIKYHHKYLGWNSRLDALQAAILRVKLTQLEAWTLARQAAARRYDQLLNDYRLGQFLAKPIVAEDRRHVFNQYVVHVANGQRDDLQCFLQRERIGCEVYYPIPLHLQECLSYLGHGIGDFPVAEAACRSVLALPMFPHITMDQQRRVMECCSAFLHGQQALAA
jgi:dTDP-4-amino-4,6-dideoxygalactose transaminase